MYGEFIGGLYYLTFENKPAKRFGGENGMRPMGSRLTFKSLTPPVSGRRTCQPPPGWPNIPEAMLVSPEKASMASSSEIILALLLGGSESFRIAVI